MKLSRLLNSLLKTAVCILDQTGEQVDRVTDRASHIAEGAKPVVYPEQNHMLRNIVTFAAGVGIGVSAGILLAPASGAETRGSIGDRVQDISEQIKSRVSMRAVASGAGTP